MIVTKGELKMIKAGRRWIERSKRPHVRVPNLITLRLSRRDPGFLVTLDRIVRYEDAWRLLVRPGDCMEHTRLLSWSGSPGIGIESDRGYSESRHGAMLDEPEAVEDKWLNRFAEEARR